jgi:hypothetical protein
MVICIREGTRIQENCDVLETDDSRPSDSEARSCIIVACLRRRSSRVKKDKGAAKQERMNSMAGLFKRASENL